MTESGHSVDRRGVQRAGGLALLLAGREAFRQVPGLRGLMLKGFVLLYGVFVVVGAVLMGGVYRFVVQPLSQGMAAYDVGGNVFLDLLVPIAAGLLWLGQALLLAATLLLSFVVSLALMSLWFEALAGRVVAHRRGGGLAEVPFSLAAWLRSLGRVLRDNVLLMVLAVLSLLLGFIPVAGPFLVFALASYLMGWEIREPYLAVRANAGEDLAQLRRGLTWWTLRVGVPAVVLAMIPWVGWLLLPVLLIYQVAGVAWLSEGASA